MRKLQVGVVGVGVLGRHHARLYQQIADIDLVGVYDADMDRARAVAAEFSTTAFDSLTALADATQCVSVAVPTDLHFPVASQLLAHGSHVLVEKPLASTLREGQELLRLAVEHNVVLHAGHVERYNPVMAYLEKKIDAPRFIEAHRLASYPPHRAGLLPRGTEVGVVLDLMIHDIDIILSLVHSDVTSIDAVGIPILSRSEDIANARINFANGCVANITASRVSQEKMRKIRVFQSNAYLSLDYQEKKGEVVTLTGTSMQRESVVIEDYDALAMELEEFVRCAQEAVASGRVPESKVAAKRALAALAVAEQITQKIKEREKRP